MTGIEIFVVGIIVFIVNAIMSAASFALFETITHNKKLSKILFVISLIPPLAFALIILDLLLIAIESVLESW